MSAPQKNLLSLLLLLLPVFSMGQTPEETLDSLMAQMTLAEKVGQMTQLSIDMISVGEPYNLAEPHQLDTAKLRKALLTYGVGSILNVGGHAYSREHWYEIHRMIDEMVQQGRLKIPVLYGIDAIHGSNYTLGATMFPQQLGQAATWNPTIVQQVGEINAYETRGSGIPWNFSPILDVMRQPLWSRTFETFGEDPYLVATLGRAMIEGYEGGNIANPYHVASCMKHYLGYSYPFTGKDRTPAYMSEGMMREIFLPPFKAAVEAGAKTIMINSGEINGIPGHINAYLLKDVLRDELGFEGVAVSDWEDIILLHTRHRVAESEKIATQMAVNAGIDMSMVPVSYAFADYLVELVEEGAVSMERIDEAVRRILKLKLELGLFVEPYYEFDRYAKFGSAEHQQVALQTALESITLLKNEVEDTETLRPYLPLNKASKILVTGPAANSQIMLNGGWSRTWQGTDPQYETTGKLTIAQALIATTDEARVTFVKGSGTEKMGNLADALKAAQGVDYIIACMGEAPATEKPGDIDELDLPQAQLDFVRLLAETGKPVILVLVEARPRIIREIEPLVKAVITCYQPGDEGGLALSKILYGDHNPEGRLPFTYPRYANSLLTYDYKTTETIATDFSNNAIKPQYPFGFGLSYTTFEYDQLLVNKATLRPGQELTVSIMVKNTGKRLGREVVQLYVQDLYASSTPPNKRLKGFKKITLLPGESRRVSFSIQTEDLAFWHPDGKWITEPGQFKLMIGGQEAMIEWRSE